MTARRSCTPIHRGLVQPSGRLTNVCIWDLPTAADRADVVDHKVPPQGARSARSKSALLSLVFKVVLCWILSVAVPSLASEESQSLPSDDSMIARFHANESDFNLLAALFRQDRRLFRNTPVISSITELGNVGVAGARIRLYEHIYSKLGIHDWRYFEESGEVLLRVAAVGISAAGATKSYLYTPTAPTSLVMSTDDLNSISDRYPIELDRQIREHWFIHVELW